MALDVHRVTSAEEISALLGEPVELARGKKISRLDGHCRDLIARSPFALLSDSTGLWIACTGSADLLLLVPSSTGAESPDAGRLHLPGEVPRGIAAMPDGTLLISSWTARSVYRGFHDGPFEPVITGLESPADLDYDSRRKRLLIPLLTGQALAIFELAPFAPSLPPR